MGGRRAVWARRVPVVLVNYTGETALPTVGADPQPENPEPGT